MAGFFIYTFLIRFIKFVRSATQSIRREMQARGRATCPELAEATGLSVVTVHKEVARLCSMGELRAGAAGSSRGGRPARVYECEARYARRVLLSVHRWGGVMRCTLELADLRGQLLSRHESTYAALDTESLDGWLDATLRRQRLASIALAFPPAQEREDLRAHLGQRYKCPTVCVTPALALAEAREGSATLYLPQGQAPTCCMWRRGSALPAGRLDLLPLPTAWAAVDYSDHTLVEETVARLVQMLTCTLVPERIVLHADLWTQRLINRIRFNTASKLRGAAPALIFRTCSAAAAQAAVRALAWQVA